MPPMPPYAPYYTCVTSHEIHEYGNMKVTMAEPSQRVSQGHLFPSHLHQQYQQYSDSVYKRMAAKSTVPNRSKLRKKSACCGLATGWQVGYEKVKFIDVFRRCIS
jgi:hypothetical protein